MAEILGSWINYFSQIGLVCSAILPGCCRLGRARFHMGVCESDTNLWKISVGHAHPPSNFTSPPSHREIE